MAKYKVTAYYEGSVELIVEADSEEEAKSKGHIEFDEVSAMEIEANICEVSMEVCGIDEEDDDDT